MAGKEKMMIASDSDGDVEFFFPLEIMFEILSRLTVASLLRCQCVCKRWTEIIQDPKFIDMHIKQTKEERVYYKSKDRTPDAFTILHNRYGLLVEKSEIYGTYRVRNPSTRQILALPSPKEVCFSMFIVFIASTDSYKLVCMYGNKVKNGSAGFKILTIGDGDLSWKAHENFYFRELDKRRQHISIIVEDSFIYCLAIYKDGSSDGQIHCLDMEAEIVNESPIIVPRSFFSYWKNVLFAKWGKKVSVMGIVGEDLHVWVVEDLIRGKWAEEKIIIPVTFLKDIPYLREKFVLFSASSEVIWFIMDDADFVAYFIRSKELWKSKCSAPRGKRIRSNVRHTMVTLKQMQPEEEINN